MTASRHSTNTATMRNVLLVSRFFPPTGGVGVERISKLAKYLPEFGWRPTVLTGLQKGHGRRDDPLLARDVEHVEVLKAYVPDLFAWYDSLRSRYRGTPDSMSRTARRSYRKRGPWDPKSWIVPDAQILWLPFALRAAMRGAARGRWAAVFGTMPVATNALTAQRISLRLEIPLVLDYRDPWTDAHWTPQRLAPLAQVVRNLEDRVFASAAAVVTTDLRCVRAPAERVDAALHPPIHRIPNGYDEADFEGLQPHDLPPFSIVHTGQLSSLRPVTPVWRILERSLEADPSLRGRIHFWQIGTIDAVVEAQMNEAPDGIHVHYVPPVPLREALRYQLGADLLVAPQGGAETTPAKIWQYLRTGRPMLGLYREGSVWKDDIALATVGGGFLEDEIGPASEFLLRVTRLPDPRGLPPNPAISQYSRREIARGVAGILDGAVEDA